MFKDSKKEARKYNDMIKLSDIKLNKNNPRKIDKERFKKLVKSLKEFPEMMELRPIIIDDDNIALGGNMRLKALKELDYKEIPKEWVKKASDLTNEQKRQFIIKDNASFGDWEIDFLKNDYSQYELDEWGVDIDFSDFEAEDEKEVVEDEIPKDIEKRCKVGDLWKLGEHRLLCGDSTSADDIKKLLDGVKPILLVTDPPYGVNYDPSWRDGYDLGFGKRSKGKVKNDDTFDWSSAFALIDAQIVYIWHAAKYCSQVAESLIKCDYEIISQIIWAKQHFVLSRGDYHWQHEACWYAGRWSIRGYSRGLLA